MNTISYSLFPTLVNEIVGFLTTEECDLIIKNIDKLKLTYFPVVDGLSTFYSCNNDLDYIETFLPIKERFQKCFDEYSEMTGYHRCKLSGSWINIQQKNAKLYAHAHPQSVLSCALYLKVDKKGYKLKFKSSNPYIKISGPYTKLTNYTFNSFKFKPKIGTLILWPSYLIHKSESSNKSNERIVLGANTSLYL